MINEWKYRSKELFKAIFIWHQETTKSRQVPPKIFFNARYKCVEVPPFFEKYLKTTVKINKMAKKQCRLTPYSFGINLKHTFSYISRNSLELYFSKIFELSFKHVYSTIVVQITGKCIYKSINWINTFLLMPSPSKTFARFSSSCLRQREITHSPLGSIFSTTISERRRE